MVASPTLKHKTKATQYYIGGQAGWTGLPYQTDTIEGVGPIPVQFNAGTMSARAGYQLSPWRFEEECSYRRNGVAGYGVVCREHEGG